MNIKDMTSRELLKNYDEILEELRDRQVIRNANPPAGGYAEYLVAKALNLTLANNSNTGFDAIGSDGIRYEIKSRRITKNKSRQLSSIRNLGQGHFDFLVGVLFLPDFSVFKACIIPHSLISSKVRFSAHTNSSLLHLRDNVWDWEGVEDITEKLKETQLLI